MKLKEILIIVFVGLIPFMCTSQADSLKTDSVSLNERKPLFIAFPAAFYTPETDWGFGAAGVYNFYLNEDDTISPSSQIQLGVSYTLKKQVLIYLPFNLYWHEFSNVIEGELGYFDYLYPYYGLGSETVESSFENYSSRYFRFQFDGFKKVNNTYLGLRYWFDNPNIYSIKENGILDSNPTLGKSGGRISGIGPQLRLDHRDNVYSTTEGYYFNAIYQQFFRGIGSEFSFSRFRLDFRKFSKIKNIVAAFQFYSDANFGDVPFFQKARIGGAKKLRGFLDGRFTDNISIVPQAEVRIPVYKERVGLAAFASVGTVFHDFKSISDANWTHSFGAGLRYTLDLEKKVKIRFDYAFTPEGSNFYFTIGEAF